MRERSKYRNYLIQVLKSRFRTSNPIYGAEIGCAEGKTSAMILTEFPKCCLFMVDPWEKGANMNRTQSFSTRTVEGSTRAHNAAIEAVKFAGNRAIIINDFSVEASKVVSEDSLDFVFIDANHLYRHVLEDLLLWYPKVKVGGIVSGDDFLSHPRGWRVWQAVCEFMALKKNKYARIEVKHNLWWFLK